MRSRRRGAWRRPLHALETGRRGSVAALSALLACGLAVVGVVALRGPIGSDLTRASAAWRTTTPPGSPSPPGRAQIGARAGSSHEPRTVAGGSAGPSSGPSASPATASPWSVVGLGDSVTSGYNCSCTPFVQRYADLTAQRLGRKVTAQNLGQAGLTSGGLLDQLQTGAIAASVADADIVLVTIGANDAAGSMQEWSVGQCGQDCFDARTAQIRSTVTQVLQRILQLRAGRPTEILLTTYWNVVEDGAVARQEFSAQYVQVSDALTREVNGALCDATQAVRDGQATPTSELICVDLYAPFKGNGDQDPTALLAQDGDHPDAAGHELIAETLLAAGWNGLGVPA
jgi:lysophospholipase L1-like esterase